MILYSKIVPAERAGPRQISEELTDERRTREAEKVDLVVQLSVVKKLIIEKAKANPLWGCSSAGRAPALQAGGQGFDSLHLHHSFGGSTCASDKRIEKKRMMESAEHRKM